MEAGAIRRPGLLTLSNELLREVLDHIEADPDKLVNLDRRAYLSQESFKPPAFPTQSQAKDVACFRLTCRRLADVGAIHQFARVTTRFSAAGFRRLEAIAAERSIAKHVKKFSYVVPNFYPEGRDRTRERLLGLRGSLGNVDVRHFIRKADEQDQILRTKLDVRALERALAAFTGLQHVQILRVQDYEDSVLLASIRHIPANAARRVDLSWAPACSHCTKTLATALLVSGSPCSRFSSPMLSTQSAMGLAAHPPQVLGTLASRLTSLELHFDDPTDLDGRMTEVSDVFRTIFTAATGMQAVHVGFPSHRPLNLKLEDVFHHVRWEKLAAFGVQAWKLDAREIITFVRRHKDRLRGLRLRDVYLKEGSLWKDVLQVIRDEMPRLDWVSLRRIGYAKRFEEQWATGGIEVEDVPGGDSESGDEDDEAHDEREWAAGHGIAVGASSDIDDDEGADTEEDDDENGPHAHEIGFPASSLQPLTSASTTVVMAGPGSRCECRGREPVSAEELGDDGMWVSNLQRKTWERWCVGRCIHAGPHTVLAVRGGLNIPAAVVESP